MLVKEKNGTGILSKDSGKHGSIYRGILELMSRFGYVSIEEVIYGFKLSEQDARNRLKYLVMQGLVRPFPSLTQPKFFYCLTKEGRRAVEAESISYEIFNLNPENYRPYQEKHDRAIVKIFLALKRLLGPDFEGWNSERTLRRQASLKTILAAHHELRVLDGLFQMRVHKNRFTQDAFDDLVFLETVNESWWCGLEVEMTLKSAERYQKQFRVLSEVVYDRYNKSQRIPLMLFLCKSREIFDALVKHYLERAETYGNCLFVFGLVEDFLKNIEDAILIRYYRNKDLETAGSDLNHVKVKVTQ